MRNFWAMGCACGVLMACPSAPSNQAAPASPPHSVHASTTQASATAPALASGTQASAAAPETLAVGEALALEAQEVRLVGTGPRSLTVHGRSGLFALAAEAPGDAVAILTLADGSQQQRRFRVAEGYCRDAPLHPALMLSQGEKIVVEVGETTEILATLRSPWVASAHAGPRKGTMTVLPAAPGHTTLMVWRADGLRLFDVYVDGACRERGYRPIATSVPNAPIGPKGDGTCRYHARIEPAPALPAVAPCPDLSTLGKLTNDELGPLACEWASTCERMGDEGCCVECNNPFRVRLKRGCAERMLRAKTCADVQKVWDTPTCHR